MLAALVLALVGSSSSIVKLAPVTLEQLVVMSDAIVIGEVERIVDVKPRFGSWFAPDALDRPNWPIAELRVLKTFKGDPAVSKRHFAAFGTWTCDTSDAKVGERALYFLTDMDPASDLGEALVPEFEGAFGAPDAAWIAHSGRGAMAISVVDGREHVTCWTEDVVVPAELPRVASTSGHDFIKCLELAPLVASIDAVRAVCVELEARRAPGIEPWTLAVHADRTATLVAQGAKRPWRELKLDGTAQIAALRALRDANALTNSMTFGGPAATRGERVVRVLGEPGALEIVLRDLDPTALKSHEHALELRTLLEEWSALRGGFEDRRCADHREADARVLAALLRR
ncbi:MAG: hypothetical protein K8S98_18560 [Planctomycetes bacterium]|nr:hypothetical protein [Planctomycetota bacterium]